MTRLFRTGVERLAQSPCGSLLGIAVLLLGGCTVGPKYVRPTADVPADYKEARHLEGRAAERRNRQGKMVGSLRRPAAQCSRRASHRFEPDAEGGTGAIPRGARSDSYRSRGVFPTVTRKPFRRRHASIAEQSALSAPPHRSPTPIISCRRLTSPRSRTFGDACAAPSKPRARKRRPPPPTWRIRN